LRQPRSQKEARAFGRNKRRIPMSKESGLQATCA
jgi:hypothetical protein